MDKIILSNMSFYAFHGVLEEEKKLGQRFYVDAVLSAELKKAGKTDNVYDTLHYGQVYEEIKKIVEGENYNLIEALAHNICMKLLERFPLLQEIQLTVKKPSAPVQGIFDYVAASITRTREDLK